MVRLLMLALLVAAPMVAAQQQPPAGKKHALLIGVKRYDNANFQNLYYTENDVSELSKILKDNGFEVTLLGDSQGADKLPTRANFMAHLDRMLKQRQREDMVVFGFAGHGIQFEGDKTSYFLPRDAEPGDSATMVSLQTVYD